MSGNRFGEAFRVTTFGESHGAAIGLVIDGVQPGLALDLNAIQAQLDRRKPGQSAITTQRREDDSVQVLSGVFEGKTTGTPIAMLIPNKDQRPGDYAELAQVLRPGHAAYTFLQKYGVFDYRGGGRASGRETACRVAAGAVALQFLAARGIEVIAYTRSIAGIEIERFDADCIERNPVRAPDMQAAEAMVRRIEQARADGDSLGGVVEIRVRSLPAGLGEPVFHKLDADLAGALMSIGAVKGFEIGSGFAAAGSSGSTHNDAWYYDAEVGRARTRSNNAGGLLGGISNGEELCMRIAVKPPSSIRKEQETVDHAGQSRMLSTAGRHDPCLCPRIVPVAEAMTALVLIDHILMQERIGRVGTAQYRRDKIADIDMHILLLLKQRRMLEQEGELNAPGPEQAEQWRDFARGLELSGQDVATLAELFAIRNTSREAPAL